LRSAAVVIAVIVTVPPPAQHSLDASSSGVLGKDIKQATRAAWIMRIASALTARGFVHDRM
jgi:hypothetical protein